MSDPTKYRSSRVLQLNIRVDSQAQVERWRFLAKAEKRTLSDWIRITLDRAVVEQETAEQALKRLSRR